MTGFWINTDKSQAGGHADGADRGREIPFEDPELLSTCYKVRVWQGRLNPIARLHARDEVGYRSLRPSNGLRGKLPKYSYLFRHLEDADLGGRHEPPSYAQSHHMLKLVLDEVETRLAARDGDDKPRRRIVIRRAQDGSPLLCAYSNHSLRVTGITHLLEAGVPFDIVSKLMAGHQSFLMTFTYDKRGPMMVMDALATAAKRGSDGSLEREVAEAASLSLPELERRFVSDSGMATVLQGAQIPGFWLPMIDGLCSNGATLCHEGGPLLEGSGRHGPVEGGARNCGLCRFFLTGPAFMAGQVLMVNALLHQGRRQAKGLRKIWAERRAETDPARRARIDDREERAKEAIDLTMRTVNARVRLHWKSRVLAAMTVDAPAEDGEPGTLLITRMV